MPAGSTLFTSQTENVNTALIHTVHQTVDTNPEQESATGTFIQQYIKAVVRYIQ